MARYDSPVEIVPWSQRRAAADVFEPWPLELLVDAQRMACAGATPDEIAEALGKNIADVVERLEPTEARGAPRPERSNVGFAALKTR
jgi:hypothetical protein